MNLIDSLLDGTIREDKQKMSQLMEKMPIFFNLIERSSSEANVITPDKFREVFSSIILHLKDLADKPFGIRVPEGAPAGNDGLCWYVMFSLYCKN